MKERPILFSSPMVRAILDGRKTQTRRALKVQPLDVLPMKGDKAGVEWIGLMQNDPPKGTIFRCKFGKPGDRLWVREAWALIDKDYKPADLAQATALVYRADGLKVPNQKDRDIRAIFADRCRVPLDAIKWRPSIHMPRIASRLDLETVAVRVERLQDISAKDIISEGAVLHAHDDQFGHNPVSAFDEKVYLDLMSLWAAGWKKINGADSWDANPFVWVIEFKRVAP